MSTYSSVQAAASRVCKLLFTFTFYKNGVADFSTREREINVYYRFLNELTLKAVAFMPMRLESGKSTELPTTDVHETFLNGREDF